MKKVGRCVCRIRDRRTRRERRCRRTWAKLTPGLRLAVCRQHYERFMVLGGLRGW